MTIHTCKWHIHINTCLGFHFTVEIPTVFFFLIKIVSEIMSLHWMSACKKYNQTNLFFKIVYQNRHILASTLLLLLRDCCSYFFSQFMSLRKRAAWILYSKIPKYLLHHGYVPGNQTCNSSEKILEREGTEAQIIEKSIQVSMGTQ